MTSLGGINGRSIQTLLRGENDSKQSDEIQAISLFVTFDIINRYGNPNATEENRNKVMSFSTLFLMFRLTWTTEKELGRRISLEEKIETSIAAVR